MRVEMYTSSQTVIVKSVGNEELKNTMPME